MSAAEKKLFEIRKKYFERALREIMCAIDRKSSSPAFQNAACIEIPAEGDSPPIYDYIFLYATDGVCLRRVMYYADIYMRGWSHRIDPVEILNVIRNFNSEDKLQISVIEKALKIKGEGREYSLSLPSLDFPLNEVKEIINSRLEYEYSFFIIARELRAFLEGAKSLWSEYFSILKSDEHEVKLRVLTNWGTLEYSRTVEEDLPNDFTLFLDVNRLLRFVKTFKGSDVDTALEVWIPPSGNDPVAITEHSGVYLIMPMREK